MRRRSAPARHRDGAMTLADRTSPGRSSMKAKTDSKRIHLAIAGLGNCASSLIEGLYHYRQDSARVDGLLFPVLAGYSVRDIEVVVAFDIAKGKVGAPVQQAIYHAPNNFVRIDGVRVDCAAPVMRGPTLD